MFLTDGRRIIHLLFFILLITGAVLHNSLARSPLGIGVAEQSVNPASPFAFFLLKIQSWQMQFELMLQNLLMQMRANSNGMTGLALSLVGLSFLYGVLHAAGPGHGKAVISSYLIADHASLQRGIALSFFSSILQASTAIAIVMGIFFFLPGRLTQTTHLVIILSYVLISLLGLQMLIRRSLMWLRRRKGIIDILFDRLPSANQPDIPAHPASTYPAMMHRTMTTARPVYTASVKLEGVKPSSVSQDARGKQILGHFRQICAKCGQVHLVSPGHLQNRLKVKTALSLIFATGLRPCNGALFVMSFALFNRLEWIAVASVFAMSLGTFITVSALACLAVYARTFALAFTAKKTQTGYAWLKAVIEWGAPLFIFLTGTLLLLSKLS